MSPGRSRAPFCRGKSAETNWARSDFPTSGTHLLIAQGTKALLGSFSLSNPGINEVVRRVRGIISWSSDQTAIAQSQIGGFGMIVVNDLALAAGAASIPGPITDGSDDGWFVWEGISSRGAETIGGGTVSQARIIDSKAMRRIEEGFGIAIMVENASGTGGEDFRFNTVLSLLASRT